MDYRATRRGAAPAWNCPAFFRGLLLASLVLAASVVRAQPEAPEPGSLEWHYGAGNAVKEEGRRLLREWRAELADERRRALEEMHSARKAALRKAAGPDILPPPLPLGTEHAFAKGMLKGKWALNRVTHTTSGGTGYGAGVRLDRTVYDPGRNMIYALTTENNLVQAPLTQLGSWTQKNHVVTVEKKGFTGVKTPEGPFRLVGSIDGGFRYSDDEGMSWVASVGGGHDGGAVYFTETMADGKILAHVRKRVGSTVSDVLIRSVDFGKTFQDLHSWPASQSNGIVTTKLYNTDDHCLLVRNRAGGAWEIHQYKGGTFSLLATAPVSATPVTVTGTVSGAGGPKVYVGTTSGGGYFSDGGAAWVHRPTLRSRLETVHPDNPNLLFSNSPQHDYSTDGGLTWSAYPNNDNTIGWDPKHLTYYKVGGRWTLVAANDMGLCFNADPVNRSTWQYVNDHHTYAILHGGTAVDRAGLTLTANQDPGTFELVRTGRGTFSARNKNSADGLRVAASNGGKAYWYRHYWETFMHSHAAPTGDNRKASFSMPGTWFTPPFKGSTAPGEDAIYVTGQNQLVKLAYNGTNNSISRTNLPHDFQAAAGGVTYGVGVAESDPDRLYVATRNGRFFRSTDAGRTWTETAYAGPKPAPQRSAFNQSAGFYIEVADTDPDLVYWGGGGNDVACLISRDGGRTFTAAQAGLPASARIGALSLSPDGQLAFSSSYHVYIASENAWFDLKAESMPTGALPYAMGLNYLPLQRKVRYFTWGAGMVDLDITHLDTPARRAVALDGTKCYQIAPATGGQALGSAGTDALQLGAPAGAPHQKWQFLNVDGFYRIGGTASPRVLEVANTSYGEGAPVRLGPWNAGDHQLWNVVRGSDSLYSLVARHSVKALDLVNGAQFQQTLFAGKAGQKWRITESPGCALTPVVDAARPARNLSVVREAGSRFRVRHGEVKSFQILVYDAEGRLIQEAARADAFDLAGRPRGLYYVKILADHVFATERVPFFGP